MGGVGDWVGWVEDDARWKVVVAGGAPDEGVAAVEGGDAAEEELADVGDGDGVKTRDALAGELADEVAEERIYLGRVGEVFHVAEQFGGNVVVMALVLLFEQACVMGAQFQIGNVGEETAAVTTPVDVTARGDGDCMRRVCCRDWGYGLRSCGLRVGFGGGRDPSPRCFDARM